MNIKKDDKGDLIEITTDEVNLKGYLSLLKGAKGIVVFAHGSGSGRDSPRNQYVAEVLRQAGFGTLLFDLLTKEEEVQDSITRHLRFDIKLLTRRLIGVTDWLGQNPKTKDMKIGYFGASTGAAAALAGAAQRDDAVGAVVSRGGRPDLAMDKLKQVMAPTLLIVGGDDTVVIELNEKALANLQTTKKLSIVQGASHLFVEPGTLETVANLAAEWFKNYLV